MNLCQEFKEADKKMGKTFIVVRTSFEALHQWPECPFNDVGYLRNLHRHIFHVEMKIETTGDRQIEFIRHKNLINKFIDNKYKGFNLGPTSCEVIAETLSKAFGASSVSVFEDNENGAVYEA